MRENLEKGGGIVHSQRVLLALTQAGVLREDAYRLVQRSAMTAWQGGGDFKALLVADEEVTKALPAERIEACFDLEYHLKHTDLIFQRLGLSI
jgi:adenylosuccinate lyase